MDKTEQMIKDYLDSWSKSRTFDYALLYDLMCETVSIFQEAPSDILEDLLVNAFYSTPGLWHYLIEVNELRKALGDKYEMLSDSVSLSSLYSSVLLNFVEGPLRHILLCILYGLKKKSSSHLTFREVCKKYRYLIDVVAGLQSEIEHLSNKMIFSSVLAHIRDVDLRFIRNKVAHHDYYIVTRKKNDKTEVKGILFVHENDINNPRNFYLEISKLGGCISWVQNLIVVLISSIDVFIKTSAEGRGLQLHDICKRCGKCGSWRVDFSMKFSEECQVCSRFGTTLKENKVKFEVTYTFPDDEKKG